MAVARADKPVIWSVSSAAATSGVVPGQAVRQALALCPQLDVIEGREAHYANVMDDIVARLHQRVYGVEPAGNGVAYLELTGLDAYQKAGENFAAALLECAPAALQPRLGIAFQRFTALIAAHKAKPKAVLYAPRDAQAWLADQPIDSLPISPENVQKLRLLGLTTLGAVARMPHSALSSAFGGAQGSVIWRLARGCDDDTIDAYLPQEKLVETLAADSPIVTQDFLMAAIEQVVNQICRSPRFSHKATRQATVTLITDRLSQWQRSVNFHQPVSDAHELARLITSSAIPAQLPGAISEIRLEISGLTHAQGWQRNLRLANGGRHEFLEEGLRKLRVQYGRCPVSQVVALDPANRLPENRWALIDRMP